jgi:hypothetical protein
LAIKEDERQAAQRLVLISKEEGTALATQAKLQNFNTSG